MGEFGALILRIYGDIKTLDKVQKTEKQPPSWSGGEGDCEEELAGCWSKIIPNAAGGEWKMGAGVFTGAGLVCQGRAGSNISKSRPTGRLGLRPRLDLLRS